jgi:hypothetical protein
MNKLTTVLVLVTLVAGFLALMTAVLVPLAVPAVIGVTSPVVCADGGTAVGFYEQRSDSQGTSFMVRARCMSGDQEVSDAGFGYVPVLAIGAFIPLFVVLFVIFMRFGKFEPENPASPDYESETITSISRRAIHGARLNADLADLKAAYEAGNLTLAEYEGKKKELLDRI